ncbi:hypothetical protein Tco_0279592, partial [Tanacetum coccineum]
MCQESKQKELKKFIADGKLHVYAVLETHLKTNSISKACDYVFRRWRWISNVTYSPTSCRIIVRWNADEIDIMEESLEGITLERIMINEYFLLQFGKAHGVFLPYLVSDHS